MKINITSLLNAEVYNHPVKKLELIETHISWVILTGDFAYKIKKPVNFGFLDFSTLEKRHQYCQQEVLLNSRLADEIYLNVVAISGSPEEPSIAPETDKGAIEYAVKMTQFPQSAQLDNMLEAGKLGTSHMEAIAHMVAHFHQSIPSTTDNQNAKTYGTKDEIQQAVLDNFTVSLDHLKNIKDGDKYREQLNKLMQWATSEYSLLSSKIEQRRVNGFVRECHGDMHLRNMVWLNDKPMAFDCIEFNPQLSWTDVVTEIAFTVMDLQDRKEYLLANRFLNTYLEDTGDYDGLQLMPFYLCYRAMVRVKVSTLRLEQESEVDENGDFDDSGNRKEVDLKSLEKEKQQTHTEFESYLELASSYSHSKKPTLIIMRGMSASGKSTVSQQILGQLGAIRIRSDVERKRMLGSQSSSSEIKQGIYSEESSKQTYQKLSELAKSVIKAGYSVIIDAAFLKYEQREIFRKLADELEVNVIILDVTATHEELKRRIVMRKNDVSDADLKVLEHQIANTKPMHSEELADVLTLDTEQALDSNKVVNEIQNRNKH